MVSLPRPLPGRLRLGRIRDQATIRWITDEVFSVFGEYGSWLPGYLTNPGVWTFVYEEDCIVLGFAMIGLIEPDERGGDRMADLLALAISPPDQGRGLGTALLSRIMQKAQQMKRTLRVVEMRLTVAETNEGARRLFATFGFTPIQGDHGFYDRGQRALRLGLKL
jgi:ribosomal protein S18 acetylase RimI-like enzyme